ncbi:MAG: hypothetical protein H6814_11105 [Phycisphaeraceae bacterium]|nr:hypothetical protein [Phycisphaeraceae bacterium]
MNRNRAIAETVHLSALGLWLGAIGVAGAAAAVAFPTMRELDPVLGAYAAFPGEHWPIAAGEVMFKVFQITDFVALVCVVLVAGTLVLAVTAGGLSVRRLSAKLRVAVAIALLVTQGWMMFVLMPRMVHNVGEFWSLARAGETDRAVEYRALFNEDHPKSRRTFETLMVFIVVSVAATGASLTDGKKRGARP